MSLETLIIPTRVGFIQLDRIHHLGEDLVLWTGCLNYPEWCGTPMETVDRISALYPILEQGLLIESIEKLLEWC